MNYVLGLICILIAIFFILSCTYFREAIKKHHGIGACILCTLLVFFALGMASFERVCELKEVLEEGELLVETGNPKKAIALYNNYAEKPDPFGMKLFTTDQFYSSSKLYIHLAKAVAYSELGDDKNYMSEIEMVDLYLDGGTIP